VVALNNPVTHNNAPGLNNAVTQNDDVHNGDGEIGQPQGIAPAGLPKNKTVGLATKQ
jgi:hypothetical protein